mgnify:CR=1 FL=1
MTTTSGIISQMVNVEGEGRRRGRTSDQFCVPHPNIALNEQQQQQQQQQQV